MAIPRSLKASDCNPVGEYIIDVKVDGKTVSPVYAYDIDEGYAVVLTGGRDREKITGKVSVTVDWLSYTDYYPLPVYLWLR